MSGYVEDNNNIVFQAFDEFAGLLNCIYFFHTNSDKHIKNIALSAMRSHVRAIIDFFKLDRSDKDDLIYTDIIDTKDDLSIKMSKDMRTFINKSTAHISKKRGTLSFDNKEYYELMKQLVVSIKDFMDRCETSLKPEYQNDFQTEDVKVLKEFIQKRLVQSVNCLINA